MLEGLRAMQSPGLRSLLPCPSSLNVQAIRMGAATTSPRVTQDARLTPEAATVRATSFRFEF